LREWFLAHDARSDQRLDEFRDGAAIDIKAARNLYA
jgi:hypothetical protein